MVSIGSAAPYLPCTHVTPKICVRRCAAGTRAVRAGARHADCACRPVLQSPSCGRRRTHGPGVRYRDAMAALDRVLPDGADIVVDAGNTGAAAIHHLPVRRDGRFVVALGMGGMGYSFGAGIGMAFAATKPAHRRRSPATASFFMHGMEIPHRDPVPAAGHLRAVQQQRPRHVRHPRATVLRRPVQLQPVHAQPAGCRAGARCSPGCRRSTSPTRRRCRPHWRNALAVDGPSVVSVECSADEIPPFAPFLTAAQHVSTTDTTRR